MDDILSSLTDAFTLAFVVTSMFSLGLAMTIKDILDPLRNVGLVALALLANFVIVPAAAYAISRVLSLEQDLHIGILLMSAVAGAPLVIKASQIARGDMRFAGALVVIQVVATVIYLPLVLPLLIPGIQVDAVAIAMPLLTQVLLPLAFGLFINSRYDEEAEMTRPIMAEISNICLALMVVLNLRNVVNVLGLLGTGAILAALLVITIGFVVGYFLGGSDGATRRVLSLGTAQRNYAAAFVLAAGNFAEQPTVFLLLLAASLISMIIMMIVAGEFGRRAKAEKAPVPDSIPERT